MNNMTTEERGQRQHFLKRSAIKRKKNVARKDSYKA